MPPRARRYALIAAALAAGMAAANVAAAAGWDMRDFETPLGDRGVALFTPAKRLPDVRLAIGCDGERGDRWRGVAVVEEPDSKVGLGMSGDVRVRFGDTSARDHWSVRTTAAGRRVYESPEATKLARSAPPRGGEVPERRAHRRDPRHGRPSRSGDVRARRPRCQDRRAREALRRLGFAAVGNRRRDQRSQMRVGAGSDTAIFTAPQRAEHLRRQTFAKSGDDQGSVRKRRRTWTAIASRRTSLA